MAADAIEPEQIPLAELDAAYAAIMGEIVSTGVAPHYAELARTLGVEPRRARALITRVIELTPGWMHPGTDWIASFPPCLLGGEPLRIEMRDEEITSVDPPTMVGYTRSMVGGDAASRPFR